jgi:DNA polymerase elongation subunit (family B)
MTSLAELTDDGPNVGATADKRNTTSKYESIHIFNVEYTDYNGQLTTHLFGRLQDGTFRHVEVQGHRPSFFIHQNEYNKRVKNHHAVVRAERGYESINGDPLVRVYTKLPKDIAGGRDSSGLRDQFNRTWEADVFYTDRFLIDTGIKTHVRIDRSEAYENESMRADYRVDAADCEPITDPNWSVEPRTLTVDIEVYSEGGFPEAEDAEWPVTAIATHDNYENAITVWLLCDEDAHDCDDSEIEQAVYQNRPEAVSLDAQDVTNAVDDVRVFRDESLLIDDFNNFVGNRSPDVLAGWNSSETDNGDAFDFPYLYNRSTALNTYSADSWSPMGQVWTTRKGREQNLTVGAKGITFLDGMTTYKKTIWSEPDGGMSLSNISSIELDGDAAKLDIGGEAPEGVAGVDAINWAWKNDWGLFAKYVIRDVQATVGVDRGSGATDLYQNLRTLTGAQLDACHNNIDLLDHYILRFARDEDIVLPTNTVPDRNWFYGGHVFTPTFGRHENTIYPDVWSEYPNAFRTCNLSPETIIGTEEDLRESEYTEDDCRWS